MQHAEPHDRRRSQSFRQVFLPEDEVVGITGNRAIDGFPFAWVPISELNLLSLRIDPDCLASQLGISFEQRVDLDNGLSDRPMAVLELSSGLRIYLVLYPVRGHMPHWQSVSLDVDPTTINRPFVDGFGGELIVERYGDELIDEVMAALGLSHDLIEWRVAPRHDPPLTTSEGMAKLEQLRATVSAAVFGLGDHVRVMSSNDRLEHLMHEPGAVRYRRLRQRYRGPLPHTFAAGEHESLPHEWAYWVDVHGPQRSWLLWEDELEAATISAASPSPSGAAT